jgi:hypothetical protein
LQRNKWPALGATDVKLTRPRLQPAPRRRGAPEHGLIAAARQQIFWKRARQRGTLTGGSTWLLSSAEIDTQR